MVVGAGLYPFGLNWRRFIVAEEQGRIVGCVQMRRHGDADELSSLVVVRSHRGRGVARLLIEHLLARESGAVHLICAARLAAFYARFGFVVIDSDVPHALRVKRDAGRIVKLPIVCMRRS